MFKPLGVSTLGLFFNFPLGLSDEEIRDMRITVVNGSNPEEEVSNHH